MTGKSFEACAQKMRDSEMSEVAVEQFKRLYDVWQNDEQEWIRESEIEPMDNIRHIGDILRRRLCSSSTEGLAHQWGSRGRNPFSPCGAIKRAR